MQNPNQIITFYLVSYQYYEQGRLSKVGFIEIGLTQRWKPYASKRVVEYIASYIGVRSEYLIPINIHELGTYPISLIDDLKDQSETLGLSAVKIIGDQE
ncbi:hypothetical protein DA098_03130 [Vibrio parahaemolyticus]|nr:hypothetical protein DA098_03130 [Vibrio parahaemolyticus]TMX79858.1 hypothetical protein DA094_05070 [Vibrio parahaemolyticus]